MDRKWTRRIFWACALGSLLAGGIVHMTSSDHGSFFWQRLPFFSGVYGFVGCIVIIVASKALGHHWLQKPEDYYDREKNGNQED